MARFFRWVIVLGVIGAAVTFGIMKAQTQTAGKEEPQYLTSEVHRGELVASFTANGTVEPEDLIDVGAQVAGRIIDFGKDKAGQEIDYGSEVVQGAVLVHIDDITYKSELTVAQAQLSSAKADLERSKADLRQMESKFDQARRDWERAQKLGPSEELAQSSYDQYRSAYEIATANVEVGKAAIKQSEAGVQQSQAAVERAQQNLSYCTIKSPADGVIIDRRVNVGQTVVASLNAPSLFLLAKDLHKMQVWVPVNEADIGNVRVDQTVTFTVDAFQNKIFKGTVGKVRLNASMTQNVVTYTVEVLTDNSSGILKPYLTANTIFETARHENVLLVPNAALKWNPAPEEVESTSAATKSGDGTPAATGQNSKGGSGRRGGRGRGTGSAASEAGGRGRGAAQAAASEAVTEEPIEGQIWVLQNGKPHAIHVQVGLNSNGETEVSSPELKEGLAVITGSRAEIEAAQAPRGGSAGAGGNPFVPQMPRRGGRGSGGGRGGRGN